MREKSCWYSLKNVVNCSKGGIKYKISAVLYIFVFNRNTILCIHVKALDSNFQLISKMLVHFGKFWNSLGKNMRHSLFS